MSNQVTNKCFECNAVNDLHSHHVVPQSLGGTATVFLCEICHGLIHNIDLRNHGNLIKAGLARAAAEGHKGGAPQGNTNRAGKRKSYDKRIVEKIHSMKVGGMSERQIANILDLPRSTLRYITASADRAVSGEIE
jgi:hypothetical protein